MKKILATLSFLAASALAACQPTPEISLDLKIQGATEKFEYQPRETVRLLGKNSKLKRNSPVIEKNQNNEIKTNGRKFLPDKKAIINQDLLDRIKAEKKRKHIILQYDGNLSETERETLKQKGVNITSPLSSKTYIASIPAKVQDLESLLKTAEHQPKYVGEYKVEDKLGKIWDKNNLGQIKSLHVLFHKDVDYQKARTILEQAGAVISNTSKEANSFGITSTNNSKDANLQLAKKLATIDEVYSVGQPVPLSSTQKPSTKNGQPIPSSPIQNLYARKFSKIDQLRQRIEELDGSGSKVLVYDAGYADENHPDVKGRTILPEDYQSGNLSSHATHVNCTVAGNGIGSLAYLRRVCETPMFFNVQETKDFTELCEQYQKGGEERKKLNKIFQGVAPKATTLTDEHGECTEHCMVENPNQIIEKNKRARKKGAIASGASLGPNVRRNRDECWVLGYYDSVATTIDMLVRGDLGNKPMAVLFSAGNERSDSENDKYCLHEGDLFGFYTIGGGPASAKNVLTIGATMLDEKGNLTISSYTSWGPLDENNARVKPTIVNYGGGENQGTISCDIWEGYTAMYGTSMAQPLTLGMIALLTQEYRKNFGETEDPTPQMLYAILVNSADDMAVGDNKYVDFKAGFGQINAVRAHELVSEEKFVEETFKKTGEIHNYFFNVKTNSKVEVTLAYIDYPGRHLINDLDVVLISPSGKIYEPHVLNPANPNAEAQRWRDDENNIEKITIDQLAEMETGIWEARVKAYDLVVGPQPYAVAFSHKTFEPKEAKIVRMDKQGDAVRGYVNLNLFWKECPECKLKKEIGPIKGPLISIGPGEGVPFDSVFPEYAPEKKGTYMITANFMRGEIPYKDKEGNLLEKTMYFIVRDPIKH